MIETGSGSKCNQNARSRKCAQTYQKSSCLDKCLLTLCSSQDAHVKHLTSGPVVILSVQRENAIGKLLDVLGPSNPNECRQESQFYLRGSYGLDRIRNALYGNEYESRYINIIIMILINKDDYVADDDEDHI